MSREAIVRDGGDASPQKFTKDPDAVLDFSLRWGAPLWLAATAYQKGDLVLDPADGYYYRAKESHTSDATARANDVGRWVELIPGLWLDDENTEGIQTSTWAVSPTGGLVIDSSSISADGKVATAFVSGGVAGTTYELTNHITTDNATPREDDRTLKIQIKEK